MPVAHLQKCFYTQTHNISRRDKFARGDKQYQLAREQRWQRECECKHSSSHEYATRALAHSPLRPLSSSVCFVSFPLSSPPV